MKTMKWFGSDPVSCDLCKKPFKDFFIDGKTTYGPWALMCVRCYGIRGCGLGPRNGQKYKLDTKEKVEG